MSSSAIFKKLEQKKIDPKSLVDKKSLDKGKIVLSASGASKLNKIAKEVGSSEKFMKGQGASGQYGTGFFSDFAKGFKKGFKAVITAPVKLVKGITSLTGLKAQDLANIGSVLAPEFSPQIQKAGKIGTVLGLGKRGKGKTGKGPGGSSLSSNVLPGRPVVWEPIQPYMTHSIAGRPVF